MKFTSEKIEWIYILNGANWWLIGNAKLWLYFVLFIF